MTTVANPTNERSRVIEHLDAAETSINAALQSLESMFVSDSLRSALIAAVGIERFETLSKARATLGGECLSVTSAYCVAASEEASAVYGIPADVIDGAAIYLVHEHGERVRPFHMERAARALLVEHGPYSRRIDVPRFVCADVEALIQRAVQERVA